MNTIAAVACNRFWQNKKKSLVRFILAMLAMGHLAVNLALTAQLLYVSHTNYPGGQAMARVHDLVPANSAVRLHIDEAAAQTGVSRFTQVNANWSYDKSEDLELTSLASFSHLLVGDTNKVQQLKKTHKTLAVVKGFSHLEFRGREYPPLAVIQENKIFILQKK
ncbi:hypothetical protein CAPTEDRAFT_220190 [Capitella teleta]|uniref:Mannosyltransferase n=1 Tax=Capitella teleta TaxID=283909 RepID=R7V1F0_CAPTE|nr:hypothetical protein CAPTEDRAFT_220190 [Capitella teleta]|eukprot:ELU12317.1 hypothetical protein CAPTEDRAFT_220190 [Capitella teleta]